MQHQRWCRLGKEVQDVQVRYLAWLEHQLNVLKRTDISEYAGAEQMFEFRKTSPLFVGLSFATISSIGPNGSVIHYHPKKESSLIINNKEVYLLDSGCQYLYTAAVIFIETEPRTPRGLCIMERPRPTRRRCSRGCFWAT